MKLSEILVRSATKALSLQDASGAMPAGHNGPYHDPETPVRNTGHWLITFLKAREISGERQFLEAAQRAANYLRSDEVRPMGVTFWHRKNPHKDTCNGLIGQAWTIEALAVAAEALEMPKLIDLAEEIFLLHPFDERQAVWRRVAVDGTYLSVDIAFNHQLWFAASGSLTARHAADEVDTRVRHFLDHLEHHLRTHPSGLIRHVLTLERSRKRRLHDFLHRLRHSHQKPSKLERDIGYHAFNLYALALLKQQYPEHPFWSSAKFNSTLHYAKTDAYEQGLQNNRYGYPYNPPGFEMAFALDVFADNARGEQETWLAKQFQRCYDFESHMMMQGTEDPLTHAARLYEVTRLPNLTVMLPVEKSPRGLS